MIGAEGVRLLKNATAFFSCVGEFEEVIQCPAGAAGQAHRTPAEREHPGAQINQFFSIAMIFAKKPIIIAKEGTHSVVCSFLFGRLNPLGFSFIY